jgi:hypothetical protein
MTFLLDANVLIALLDPQHMHRDPAHAWFDGDEDLEWATCPLEQCPTRLNQFCFSDGEAIRQEGGAGRAGGTAQSA